MGEQMWGWGGGGLWVPSLSPLFSRSYIWQHIEIGYVQGMCDLLAPLLVILDDGECAACLSTRGQGSSWVRTGAWNTYL